MQEVAFEREVRGEPARVLQRAEKWLSANGYEVSARSSFELSLVGVGTGGRHRLTVSSDGQHVRFAFAPGSPGVTLPEKSVLERKVDGALQDVGPAAAGPAKGEAPTAGGHRCAICATVLGRDERTCPVCGMTA